MIRILFGLMVVTGVLLIPLFAAESRAESQQNQTQVAAKSAEELQIESLKQEIVAIQNQDEKQIEELQKKLQDSEAKKAKEPEKGGGLANIGAGYKDGLFIKTNDDKFSLKFNTLIQGQFFIQNFDDNRKMGQVT